MTNRSQPFRLLSVLLALVVFLSLDFGLRQIYLVFRKEKKTESRAEARQKFPRVPHPVYHHGLKENSWGWDFYGPRETEYFSNSLGMRDGAIRPVLPEFRGPRLLLIGDSFTEGIGIPWEKTFAGLLSVRYTTRGVEILNAGVSSFCPTIMRARLQDLLEKEKIKIDQVVLFLDISDIKDELFYERTPEGSVRAVPYGPLRGQAARLEQIDNVCAWLELNVEKNFVLVGAIVRNLRLSLRKYGPVNGIRAFEMIDDWANAWPDYQGPYLPFIEEGLKKAKAEMGQIRDLLVAKRVAFAVVIYPWPQQIRAGSRPSRAETEWLSWCEEEQVPCLNLFPYFMEKVPAKQTLAEYFIPGDCHWNEAGHLLVANALERFLGQLNPEFSP